MYFAYYRLFTYTKHYFYTNSQFYCELALFLFRFFVFRYYYFPSAQLSNDDLEDTHYRYSCAISVLLVVILGYTRGLTLSFCLASPVESSFYTLDHGVFVALLPWFECWLFVHENNHSQVILSFIL